MLRWGKCVTMFTTNLLPQCDVLPQNRILKANKIRFSAALDWMIKSGLYKWPWCCCFGLIKKWWKIIKVKWFLWQKITNVSCTKRTKMILMSCWQYDIWDQRITWQYKFQESAENDSHCEFALHILRCTAGNALYENKEVQYTVSCDAYQTGQINSTIINQIWDNFSDVCVCSANLPSQKPTVTVMLAL